MKSSPDTLRPLAYARILYAPGAQLECSGRTARVSVAPGDWDLDATPLDAGNASIRSSETRQLAKLPPFHLEVAVGRSGQLVLLDSLLTEQVRSLIRADSPIHVRVLFRHPEWNALRRQFKRLAKTDSDGLLYTEMLHPDLVDIPAWNGGERWEAIHAAMRSDSEHVLDIGAHLGYMCMRLEDWGRKPTAVEIDEHYCSLMRSLRQATGHSFPILQADVTEMAAETTKYDAVLALAIFHHYLKTESGFHRLVGLLQSIRANELFLWTHNPAEPQMANAYRNYAPDEFADFVALHCGFTSKSCIGVFKHRPLFRLGR